MAIGCVQNAQPDPRPENVGTQFQLLLQLARPSNIFGTAKRPRFSAGLASRFGFVNATNGRIALRTGCPTYSTSCLPPRI